MITRTRNFAIGLLAFAGLAAAQDPNLHGWRTAGPQDQNAQYSTQAPQNGGEAGPQDPGAFPPPRDVQQNFPQQPPPPPDNFGVPAKITIPQGSFVTVRMNQFLSSDKNQPGDTFFATLAEPLVVDGVVVAQRGQNVAGRVTEAVKAGMAKGVSRLGIQLTELTLVDGQQVPVQTQVVDRKGPTSVGRDVGAIGATTGLGAALGAAVDWGRGAAIGAGAGAAAGILGVLLTRGEPTVVPPETLLTFRVEAPVAFSTERAPQAFRYVDPHEYQGGPGPARPPYSVAPGYPAPGYPAPAYPMPVPYYAPAPYYYGYGYAYPYYGGFGVYIGPRFYGGRYYVYRGGFRR